MKLSYCASSIDAVTSDALLVPVCEFDPIKGEVLAKLDDATSDAVTTLMDSGEFTGKEAQLATLYKPNGFDSARVILIGLGDKKKINADCFRRAMGRASRDAGVYKSEKIAVWLGEFGEAGCFQAVIEGYLLGAYKNLAHKSGEAGKSANKVEEIVFATGKKQALSKIEKAVERGRILAEGTILARDLTSTPGNYLTPTIYADKAKKLARKYGVTCQVLDKAAIAKEKMGAFLSVAEGSDEPPKFIILRYDGGPAKQKPIVLVGKGITFDSGGISLKAGLNMHEMKQDMGGSAVVISTIVTAARLGIKRNIVVLVPACENMPSGRATKPGDIITSRKGKTVEIINTDAEGRLILADALDYANKFDPQAVIDCATLTGASLYILGYAGAPIMGNNDKLLESIETASDTTAELVWHIPIWDEHRDIMKSDIADLRNSGGKTAGTICAAAFLENFIGDWPWAHVDIAYMDLEPSGRPYIPKGATGYGVRLLTEMLANWKKV